MKKIYFDYAATTPMAPEVISAMRPYFKEKFGNPGSLHYFGQEAMAAVDVSRETIAKTIGANFNEIIFTGSATEANNLTLRGVVKNFNNALATAPQNQNNFFPAKKFSSPSARHPAYGGNQAAAPAGCSSGQSAIAQNFSPLRIIISAIEHESILETARALEKEGVEIIYLPVDKQGFIDLKKLKESLNEQTILVSVMYANNEIGTIQPIQEISKIINDFKEKRNYPLFHTDAVQAFQFLNCPPPLIDTTSSEINSSLKIKQGWGIDLMTLSAHKIYGPKGIGALYAANRIQPLITPIITGGGQEFGLRSGTENVPAIAGFAKAAELIVKNRAEETKRVGDLTDYFWQEIKKIEPKAEINGVSSNQLRLPNILNICFSGQNAQDLLIKLDINGVAVSSGSACSAKMLKPSYVLKAIGLPDNKIKNSVRFSFGKFTTKKEIIEALKIIKFTIQDL